MSFSWCGAKQQINITIHYKAKVYEGAALYTRMVQNHHLDNLFLHCPQASHLLPPIIKSWLQRTSKMVGDMQDISNIVLKCIEHYRSKCLTVSPFSALLTFCLKYQQQSILAADLSVSSTHLSQFKQYANKMRHQDPSTPIHSLTSALTKHQENDMIFFCHFLSTFSHLLHLWKIDIAYWHFWHFYKEWIKVKILKVSKKRCKKVPKVVISQTSFWKN